MRLAENLSRKRAGACLNEVKAAGSPYCILV